MLQALKARIRHADRQDEGFTLIELMVVVLIIAVLLAIAIPTFLGVQNKAKDRAAQSSVRNAVTAAKAIYADDSNYTLATVANLGPIEPSLTFQTAASTTPKQISVAAAPAAQVFVAVAKSQAGSCFFIRDNATSTGTEFNSSTGTCDVASAPATGWSTTGW